jgi:hypothetical protein
MNPPAGKLLDLFIRYSCTFSDLFGEYTQLD